MLAGGGVYLWNKYKDKLVSADSSQQRYSSTASSPADVRAERIIRALVYAAKADGHIDDLEKAAIDEHISKLNLGDKAHNLVNQALNEPLAPAKIAAGLKDPEEALQLYALSSSIVDADNPLEKAYLDQLACELAIPAEISSDVDAKIRTPAAAAHAN